MSSITVEFRYEIGELVYIRGATNTGSITPNRFVIIERMAQQCHADFQRLYRLVGFRDLVPEIAITRDEPEYQPRHWREPLTKAGFDNVKEEADDQPEPR